MPVYARGLEPPTGPLPEILADPRRRRILTALRWLIVADIVTIPLIISFSVFEKRWYPAEIRSFVEAEEKRTPDPQTWATLILGLSVLALFIIAWSMLWSLQRPGRLFYTVAWAVALPIYFAERVEIHGPGGAIIDDIAGVLSGMIFGIIYFSPLGDAFAKRSADSSDEGAAAVDAT